VLGIVPTDLHLHGAVPPVEEAPHLVEQRLALEMRVDAAPVGADAIPRPAEEPG
jgi:hypothetical protein